MAGGQPNLHVLVPSKQSFFGRVLGSAPASPVGLEGAGLHDNVVLDSKQLILHRYQDEESARKLAVFLPQPEVAQRAPRQGSKDSPHCQICSRSSNFPGAVIAEGCFRALFGNSSPLES